MRLDGKVCLVTGGSRGIGAAIAAYFAEQGASVIVHYGSDRAAADRVCSELAGTGHIVLGADLLKPENVPAFVEQAIAAAGRIDVLVNNAGIYGEHPILQVDAAEWLEAWQEILAVNLVSPAVLCHAVAKPMAVAGSSISGQEGLSGERLRDRRTGPAKRACTP